MKIIDLNDDCLRKIFIYLGFRDLVYLSVAHKRFKHVANSTVKYTQADICIKTDSFPLCKFDEIFLNIISAEDELTREEFLNKYSTFLYIENLRLVYKCDFKIDLSAFPRLKKIDLNLSKVLRYNFVKNKIYKSVKCLYVKEFNNKLNEIFPNLNTVHCDYIQTDLTESKIKVLEVDVLNLNNLDKLSNLKDLHITWSVMNLNYTILPSICLLNLPNLDNFHVTFNLRKGFLKLICNKILKLIKIVENRINKTKLHIYFTFNKDVISLGYDDLKDCEIYDLYKNAETFLPKLSTFQINGLDMKIKNFPLQFSMFKLIGTKSISDLDLHLINQDLSFELQKLKQIQIKEDGEILKKLSEYKLNIKRIIINCKIKQEILDKIPDYFPLLNSFYLKEKTHIYNIDFLTKLNNLRYLTLQISHENDIKKLIDIVQKCSVLNYLTIYLHHLEEVKNELIEIYKERSANYPYMIIIVTAYFKQTDDKIDKTNKIQINNNFFINILPD